MKSAHCRVLDCRLLTVSAALGMEGPCRYMLSPQSTLESPCALQECALLCQARYKGVTDQASIEGKSRGQFVPHLLQLMAASGKLLPSNGIVIRQSSTS